MSDPLIRELQALLNRRGLNAGPEDGLLGPRTLDAFARGFPGLAQARPQLTVDDNTRLLIKELERDEGRVLHAYQDHLGYWTLGIGRLIDKRRGGGITDAEADYLKLNDIAKVRAQLDAQLPWWRNLDPERQRAIQNMAFQLGIGGLMKFTASLERIRTQDWAGARRSLEQSLWARQTPARARRVIDMIDPYGAGGRQ